MPNGCHRHMRPAYAPRMCTPLVHGRTDGRTDADALVTLDRSLAFSDAHAQARGGLISGQVTT